MLAELVEANLRQGVRAGLSTVEAAVVLVLLVLAIVIVVYVDAAQGNQDQITAQNQQISELKLQLQHLTASIGNGSGLGNATSALPVMNQPPTIRTIRETWYLSTTAHQDRFDPAFVVVNQGDRVEMTLIDNDTVAHDFVIGPPYSIVVNATVPGLINDLTGQKFTTLAKNNSPGVVVSGAPGSVQAVYSFTAKYSGIYEFVCTYHAQVGMIGYLVVLPNKAYAVNQGVSGNGTGTSPAKSKIGILPGAGTNVTSKGFNPGSVTVVIGVNNTIQWTNNDSSPHTVTADDASFSSGNMAPGQTFIFTFLKAGVYHYHCTYHPWMTGTVTVVASS